MNIPTRFNKLKRSSQLAQLLARARQQASLDAGLKTLLEAPVGDHCQVLALRNQVLVVAADSPVWAVRLRFLLPRLVKQLSRQFSVPISTVKVRVNPIQQTPAPKKRPIPGRCGPAGRQAALLAAQSVSDPDLKSALLKLANHRPTRQPER
jgi:hypothetical protein